MPFRADCRTGAVIAIIASNASNGYSYVRRLDESTQAKLRVRAAHSGRSMEGEAREILRQALEREPAAATDLATAIRELFRPLGGVELELPERDPIREPPDLE